MSPNFCKGEGCGGYQHRRRALELCEVVHDMYAMYTKSGQFQPTLPQDGGANFGHWIRVESERRKGKEEKP